MMAPVIPVTRDRSKLYGFGQSGDRLEAPATQRNRTFILEVLKAVLPDHGTVLEIASGSGEHAVFFAPELEPLSWLPSDPKPDMNRSIAAWRKTLTAGKMLAPVALDVLSADWAKEALAAASDISAMVCINMIHVAPIEATHGLLEGAGQILPEGAPLMLYGPYKIDGKHTAPSNEAFDLRLQGDNPTWGVRDLGDICEIAAGHGLEFQEKIQMPANNFSVIFRKAIKL